MVQSVKCAIPITDCTILLSKAMYMYYIHNYMHAYLYILKVPFTGVMKNKYLCEMVQITRSSSVVAMTGKGFIFNCQ